MFRCKISFGHWRHSTTFVAGILFVVVLLIDAHAQSTWKILPNAPDRGMRRHEDIYFVNETIGWAVADTTIIKTSDGGISWQVQFNQKTFGGFRSVGFADSLRGWAGTLGGELYQTTDGGLHWNRIDQSITPPPTGVCDLSVTSDSTVFGSGRWSGPANLMKSEASSTTWTNQSLDQYASLLVGCKFFNRNTGFVVGANTAANEGGIVLYTSDGGANWEARHKTMRPNEHVWNITFVSPIVGYATVQNPFQNPTNFDTLAIIKTTNGGLTWQRKGLVKASNSFRYAESIGFATEQKGWVGSGAGTGMYETNDGGDTWTFLNFGTKIHGMHILNDSVGYACGKTIYKYSPERTPVGVDEEERLPLSYRLEQNHPNPFNASTKIRYSLPARSFVWLSIYNLEGKLIQTLERGFQEAGDHTMTWNAGNLPSGVYVYSLRTDEGILVGKAMLIK